jgi:endonuclease/exonuclease/phosphatase family metal-dependent hydrolase
MQQIDLLSYNIQAGIYSRQYSDYLTNSWKHILPYRERLQNLTRIAVLLRQFDVVGLQEVDSGSLRSAYVDQIQYLAHMAGFPHWYRQVNRNLGPFAQHSNGVLSRIRPHRVTEHRLPGLPGRGAVVAELPTSDGGQLAICVLHLALGRRARALQFAYLRDLADRYPYLVMMGDFNCTCRSKHFRSLVAGCGLRGLDCGLKTYPSWRPRHNLDHVLTSSALRIVEAKVLDYPFSDHLPLAVKVALPASVSLLQPTPSWVTAASAA